MKQRMTVRYEGRVQGVGFRYTVVNLAKPLRLTGYVRNEFDGSVVLIAEGSESKLTELLQNINRSHLARHITACQIGRSAATGEFKSFSVQ
ncbi:MAG: acylphosphatase [Kiritimatiellaceae bacterium]|nr:acylphosphatase [Kiritimatiellaceae bacterium]